MTSGNAVHDLRYRLGALLPGTTLDIPPGWCGLVELMLEDVARWAPTPADGDGHASCWKRIMRTAEGLEVVFRGPADPRIDAAIESATALAESTCEHCGSGGRRAWPQVDGVRCALCAFEARLAADHA